MVILYKNLKTVLYVWFNTIKSHKSANKFDIPKSK